MALKKCPDCAGSVSDQASACPHCGRPMFINKTRETTCEHCKGTGLCKNEGIIFKYSCSRCDASPHLNLKQVNNCFYCIGTGSLTEYYTESN